MNVYPPPIIKLAMPMIICVNISQVCFVTFKVEYWYPFLSAFEYQ